MGESPEVNETMERGPDELEAYRIGPIAIGYDPQTGDWYRCIFTAPDSHELAGPMMEMPREWVAHLYEWLRERMT